MNEVSKLTWPQRLVLYERFNITASTFCRLFHCTENELKYAIDMYKAGTLVGDLDLKGFRPSLYRKLFECPDTDSTPVKKRKSLLKIGRPGDKIKTAFMNIPLDPIPVSKFAQQYNISTNVIRQHSRFVRSLSEDIQTQIGKIFVKQNEHKVLVIWREVK